MKTKVTTLLMLGLVISMLLAGVVFLGSEVSKSL